MSERQFWIDEYVSVYDKLTEYQLRTFGVSLSLDVPSTAAEMRELVSSEPRIWLVPKLKKWYGLVSRAVHAIRDRELANFKHLIRLNKDERRKHRSVSALYYYSHDIVNFEKDLKNVTSDNPDRLVSKPISSVEDVSSLLYLGLILEQSRRIFELNQQLIKALREAMSTSSSVSQRLIAKYALFFAIIALLAQTASDYAMNYFWPAEPSDSIACEVK